MALKLTLRPSEKVMINGVLMENIHGGKARLLITTHAYILRERDMLNEEEASSPATIVYFQAMKLSGGDPDGDVQDLMAAVLEFKKAHAGDKALMTACERIVEKAGAGAFYDALVACRALIASETPDHPILRATDRQ